MDARFRVLPLVVLFALSAVLVIVPLPAFAAASVVTTSGQTATEYGYEMPTYLCSACSTPYYYVPTFTSGDAPEFCYATTIGGSYTCATYTTSGTGGAAFAAYTYSGTTVYRVTTVSGSCAVYFDYGTLGGSGGAISWQTEAYFTPSTSYCNAAHPPTGESVAVDSNGYWWIAFSSAKNAPVGYFDTVWECAQTAATCLSTPADFSLSTSVSFGASTSWLPQLVSLGSSHVALYYFYENSAASVANVEYYSGSAWSVAAATVASYTVPDFSAFNGNTAGCGVSASGVTYLYSAYTTGTPAWTATVVDNTVTTNTFGCGIATDGSTNIGMAYTSSTTAAKSTFCTTTCTTAGNWAAPVSFASGELSTPSYFGVVQSLTAGTFITSWTAQLTGTCTTTTYCVFINSFGIAGTIDLRICLEESLAVSGTFGLATSGSYISTSTATGSYSAGGISTCPLTVVATTPGSTLTVTVPASGLCTSLLSTCYQYWMNSSATSSTTQQYTAPVAGATINLGVDSYYSVGNVETITANAQADFDPGLTALTITGTYKGASVNLCGAGGQYGTIAPDNSHSVAYCGSNTAANIVFADIGATISGFPTTLGGAPSGSEWRTPSPCAPAPASAGNTENCNYWKRWFYPLDYALGGAQVGTPTAPAFTCNIYGSSTPTTLTTSLVNYPCDNGAAWSITHPTLTGSNSTDQWTLDPAITVSGTTSSSSPTTAGGGGLTWTYWQQFKSYWCGNPPIQGAWDGAFSIPVTANVYGSPATIATLTTRNTGDLVCSALVWSDSGAPVSSVTIIADGSNQRWHADTTTYSPTSAGAHYSFDYFQQIQLTFYLDPLTITGSCGSPCWDAGRTVKVSSSYLGIKTVLWTYSSANGDGKQSKAFWFDTSNFLDCESSTGGTGNWVSNMTETPVLSTPGGTTGTTCGYTLSSGTTTTATTTTTTTTPTTTTTTTTTYSSTSTTTTTAYSTSTTSTTTTTTTETSFSPTVTSTHVTTTTTITSTGTLTTTTTAATETTTKILYAAEAVPMTASLILGQRITLNATTVGWSGSGSAVWYFDPSTPSPYTCPYIVGLGGNIGTGNFTLNFGGVGNYYLCYEVTDPSSTTLYSNILNVTVEALATTTTSTTTTTTTTLPTTTTTTTSSTTTTPTTTTTTAPTLVGGNEIDDSTLLVIAASIAIGIALVVLLSVRRRSGMDIGEG